MHSVGADRFRTILGHVPTGVVIVTGADEGGQPVGFTCGSFFSVSLDPPLVGFCVAKTSTSWPLMAGGARFCVNLLAEDQQDISSRFARKGGDKFGGLSWQYGPLSLPYLDRAVAWIWCETADVHEAGDHVIVVGAVSKMLLDPQSPMPLVFHRGGYSGVTEFAPARRSQAS